MQLQNSEQDIALKGTRYIVIDVDGTMTDAGIYYDENGNELKKFSTKDAAGFGVAQELNIKTVVLTGRECLATTRRMKELKVDYLYQNVHDKRSFLEAFINKYNIAKDNLFYIGDDINDLSSMKLAGFVGCPIDSCKEILEYADYISPVRGGNGCVRDIIEHILRKTGEWDDAIKKAYGIGI